jgi:hypothetical protein
MCSVAHEIRGLQTDDSFLLNEPVFAVVQDPTDPSENRKAGLLLRFEGQYEKYTFGNQGVIHLVDLGTKRVVDIGVVSASDMLKICDVFDSATTRIYDFPWNKGRGWGRIWRNKKGHSAICDVSKNCIREHKAKTTAQAAMRRRVPRHSRSHTALPA